MSDINYFDLNEIISIDDELTPPTAAAVVVSEVVSFFSKFVDLNNTTVTSRDIGVLVKLRAKLQSRRQSIKLHFGQVPFTHLGEENLFQSLSMALTKGVTVQQHRAIRQRLIQNRSHQQLVSNGRDIPNAIQSFSNLYKKTIRIIRSEVVEDDFVFEPQSMEVDLTGDHPVVHHIDSGAELILVCFNIREEKIIFDALVEYNQDDTVQQSEYDVADIRNMLLSFRQRIDSVVGMPTGQDQLKPAQVLLHNRWHNGTWKNDILQIERSLNAITDIRIAVVGDMGVGKSYALNTIIGEEVLTSRQSGEAVTSAITEVSYEDRPDDDYCVTVEFLSKQDWFAELDNAMNEITLLPKKTNDDYSDEEDDEEEDEDDAMEHKKAVVMSIESKLEIMYGEERAARLLGTMRRIRWPKNEKDEINAQRLFRETREEMLPKFKEALEQGTRHIVHNHIDDVRETVVEYTTHDDEECELWIIVKRVKITGRFERIKGISLVDLPGTADANPIRAEMVEAEKRRCNHLYIVAQYGRIASSTTVVSLLKQFLTQNAVMEGRLTSSAVIATKCELSGSDDRRELIREVRIGREEQKEYNDDDLLEVRKSLVRSKYFASLKKYVSTLSIPNKQRGTKRSFDDMNRDSEPVSHSHESEQQQLLDMAMSIPLFVVSARQYRQYLETGNYDPIQDTSGFPALFTYMKSTVAKRSEAIMNVLRQIQQFVARLRRELNQLTVQLNLSSPSSVRPVFEKIKKLRIGVERVVEDSSKFAQKHIVIEEAEYLQFFLDHLGLRKADTKKIAKIMEEYKTEKKFHWCTYRAVCRHMGVYNSAAKGRVNFNEDIAAPIQRQFTSAWLDFFNNQLPGACNKFRTVMKLQVQQSLHTVDQQYRSQLERFLGSSLNLNDLSKLLHGFIDNEYKHLCGVIREKQLDINAKFAEKVQQHLTPGYRTAASIRGTGSYARMVSTMYDYTLQNGTVMLNDCSQEILESVSELLSSFEEAFADAVQVIFDRLSRSFDHIWDLLGVGQNSIDNAALLRNIQHLESVLTEEGRKMFGDAFIEELEQSLDQKPVVAQHQQNDIVKLESTKCPVS